jgi:hypothetical protein
MKLFDSWPFGPIALSFVITATFAVPLPSWAEAGNALFGNGNGTSTSGFDEQFESDSRSRGNIDPTTGYPVGNVTPGVLGESNPGWGANQVNTGNFIPGAINDYPNWSSSGSASGGAIRSGGNGPNQRHQFPIGVRGGVPETSTKLIAPTNDLANGKAEGSGFEGQHSFGFTGDQYDQYRGVRSNYKGVAPQSGGSLPPTGTGAVNVSVTDGW